MPKRLKTYSYWVCGFLINKEIVKNSNYTKHFNFKLANTLKTTGVFRSNSKTIGVEWIYQ